MNFEGFEKLWEDYHISLSIILIIFGSWLLTRIIRTILQRWLLRTYEEDPSSATAISFLKNAVSLFFFIVALLAVIYTIPALRTLADTLTIGAGVVAATAAFASQAAFANLVGGIFIVIFRPFRVGDRIFIGKNYEGLVVDITLRHTVIRDWEKKHIIIPNSVISTETIVNSDLTGEKICRFVEIPISYDTDLKRACAIIAEESMKHPNYTDVRTPDEITGKEAPFDVRIIRYEGAGAILRAYLWGDLASTFVMAADLRLAWHEALRAEGIKLGVAHRMWEGESGVVLASQLSESSS